MSFKVTKSESYNFNYQSEIDDINWNIRYCQHLENASKNYLKKLEKAGENITRPEAQKLRAEYDKERDMNNKD